MQDFDINPNRKIQKFIKRLEKKGIITGKVKNANYRKVRVLRSKSNAEIKIIFNCMHDRNCEMELDIDVLSVSVNTAEYLNSTFNEIKKAIGIFRQQSEEALNVKHTDTGSSNC